MRRYLRHTSVLFSAAALVFVSCAGAAEERLTLADTIQRALVRDVLVREARRNLETARLALIQVSALTPTLKVGSNMSSTHSAGLDPQSAVSGTSYASQSYDWSVQVPMRGGTSVNLLTSASTSTTNSELRAGGGQSFSFAEASVAVGLSRPLPVFRNERVLTEGGRWSAEIAVRTAEVALEEARRRVAADALDYFFAAVRARREAEIAEASQGETEELLRIAQEKLKLGKVAEIEVTEARVSADAARSAVRGRQSAAASALDALQNFLGIPLEQAAQLSYEPAVETPAPALSEAELVQQAFAKRTDLQRLGLDIRGARLSVRQAQAQAKPGVLLSGGYARSGEAATITESYGRLENPSWSVGLVTNVSLDLKADRAAIAQAQSSLRLAELNEKLRRDEVRLWIRRLLRELGDADANAVLLGETVQIAQENLRIRQVQFEHGLIRAVDVMQTERQLNETRDQYLNAVIDRELARARLRLAIGEMPLS